MNGKLRLYLVINGDDGIGDRPHVWDNFICMIGMNLVSLEVFAGFEMGDQGKVVGPVGSNYIAPHLQVAKLGDISFHAPEDFCCLVDIFRGPFPQPEENDVLDHVPALLWRKLIVAAGIGAGAAGIGSESSKTTIRRQRVFPFPGEEAFPEKDHAQHPAGRIGKPEDIASLAAFLVSGEASFITGANFTVDGGMTRKMIYA